MVINKTRVREAMDTVGIQTQSQLAEMIGITKNQLSVILSDKYNPLKSTYQTLCEVLEVIPVSLLDNSNNSMIPINLEPQRGYATAIELFAGGGGLALGLEQAGINTLLHVDNDKASCETLKRNRPNWNVVCSDVTKVDYIPYQGIVDIVTGGFPCQAFSYAGKKLGFEDTRGTLFYEFARCVKETQPQMFLAENVKGLLTHENGKTLQTIIEIFSALGYNVQYKLLNAVNYGVPQKRERVVIIGTRDNLTFSYPEPQKQIKTLRDALDNVPLSEGQKYSANREKVLKLVPQGGCWRDLPKDIQKTFMGKSYYSGGGRTGMARRIAWNEPSLTLTCSPSQKQTERCHPDETRPFTVREYARIQTFPDNWEFCGGMGDKYKQIGNAVPVEFARQLGFALINALTDN